MYPAVQSIAAVPSGLTRYRKGLYKLEPYDAASSAAVLDILEETGRCLQKSMARALCPGRRVVFVRGEGHSARLVFTRITPSWKTAWGHVAAVPR